MKRFSLFMGGILLAAGVQAQIEKDSPRLAALVRAGNAYLSLHDAIAIALENNLDVELEHLGPRFAETEVKRARAGGLLRGVPLAVREGPKSASSAADVLAPALGPGSSQCCRRGRKSPMPLRGSIIWASSFRRCTFHTSLGCLWTLSGRKYCPAVRLARRFRS